MQTNAFGMAPFETERLLGREWLDSDVEAAFAIYGDGEVMRGLSASPTPDLEAQGEWLSKAVAAYRERAYGTGFWALERKQDGRIVGAAVVKPIPGDEDKIEVGWQLAREFWGNGYAVEGAREAVRIAFQCLSVGVLYALVLPWNERSLKVAARLGFARGETTTAYYSAELVVHTLSRESWQNQTQREPPLPS